MRRDDLAETLCEPGPEGYVFPDYGEYAIPGIMGSLLSVQDARPEGMPTLPADALGSTAADEIEHVVFVLVDGLGYDSWRASAAEADERDLVDRIEREGTVTPLTSVFPSETAAALTTILTGQYPIEHGLLGWWGYLDAVGRVQTLPYQTEDDEDIRTVHPDVGQPWETLYTADPLAPRLPPALDTALFTPEGTDGDYPHTFGMAAHVYHDYETVPDLGVGLRRAVEDGCQLATAYIPHVDSASHEEGPRGGRTTARLDTVLAVLRRELCERLDPDVADRTLLVLSADHGHVDTGGENIDIGEFAPLWDALERVDGEAVPPLGGPRQLQLHLRDGTAETVAASLEAEYDCLVIPRAEYERRNLFGPGDRSAVLDRLPDLLCTHRERAMWDLPGSLEHVGVHGGLHRAEMLVPFAVARVSTL